MKKRQIASSVRRRDLRFWRIERKLTVAELAEKTGLHVRTIRCAEHGEPVTLKTLGAILKALEIE